MKCPHCQTEFHDDVRSGSIGSDADGIWSFETRKCPACNRLVIELVVTPMTPDSDGSSFISYGEKQRYLVRPKAAYRTPPPAAVPADIAQYYKEACTILNDSPMASAALSRRCLQAVLRDRAGVKKDDLAKEISEVLAKNTLPSHLADAIDAVRNIGHFAAHPVKSTSTGQILPVESGEAEWTLEVLDLMFDFYYLQPAITAQRRAALNAKLASAGKPPVK